VGRRIAFAFLTIFSLLVQVGCEDLWVRRVAHNQAFPEVVFDIQWGSYGTAEGEFSYPNGITVDSNGQVYVVDSGNSRIQKFDADGNYLLQWGTSGGGTGEFLFFGTFYNNSITVDASNNVFVCDAGNNRI
jgi:tripartite motif-containing protein 71